MNRQLFPHVDPKLLKFSDIGNFSLFVDDECILHVKINNQNSFVIAYGSGSISSACNTYWPTDCTDGILRVIDPQNYINISYNGESFFPDTINDWLLKEAELDQFSNLEIGELFIDAVCSLCLKVSENKSLTIAYEDGFIDCNDYDYHVDSDATVGRIPENSQIMIIAL